MTPERVLFSGDVDEVTMRTDEGEISFLAAHEDYIAAVDVTVARLSVVGGTGTSGGPGAPGGTTPPEEGSGQELRVAVHGGFVQVDHDGVTILASVAELAAEIDVDRARRSLEAAQTALPDGDRPTDQILAEAAAVSGELGEVVPAESAAEAGGPGGPAAPALAVSPSPSMLALLAPDSPEVRARRARARLSAAGVAVG